MCNNILSGRVKVEPSKIAAEISSEVFNFYRTLAYKEYPNLKFELAFPRHGHHVTIARSPLHNFDYKKVLEFQDKEVGIEFGAQDIYVGGLNKGFVGFYTYIKSKELEEMRRILGINNYNDSLHITMFSTKSQLKNKWK